MKLWISLTIHLHSCRDYGFKLLVWLLLAVCQIVPVVHLHPSIMTVAAKDKRHKQQKESKVRRPSKDVLSQEQKEQNRCQQYQEHDPKR
jgi:hypothetical protein